MTAGLWDAARVDWQNHLRRTGLADSTRHRLNKQLLKFSRECDRAPFDVTAGDVEAWIGSLQLAPNTRYLYRAAVRNFYRWAYRAGRVPADPMAGNDHPLAGNVPTSWADALREHQRWGQAKGLSAGTVRTRRECLEMCARQTGAASPWLLTQRDLAGWMASHRWARETLRRARSTLRDFYTWAELMGYVEYSPADELPHPRAANHLPRPASEDAYKTALWQADERTGLMLRLAAELGLRRVEVAELHSDDLIQDHTRAWWLHVHGKGGKVRAVPLPPDLALELRQRDPGFVFPGSVEGHLSARWVGKLVALALPQGVTMHQLRHRFATQAYQATRNLFAVQRLLGHASPMTTQRYVETAPDELRGVVDAVSAVRWRA